MAKGVVKDEQGVELAIEHNQGMLQEVKFPDRGKRNGSVTIIVPGLQHPQLPSFDTRDRALVDDLTVLADKLKGLKAAALKKAVDEGLSDPPPVELWVAFRAHVVRDDKLVEPTVPWDQVPSDAQHRHKRLMAIAEDRTDAAAEILRQAEFECKAGVLGAQPTRPAPAAVPNQPSQAEPLPSGGSQADTYAFAAACGMVTWAFEIYQEGGEAVKFTGSHVRTLAAKLLDISDALQAHLTAKPVNRNANSHTRVRGVLRTVVERHPVPVHTDEVPEWEAWEDKVRKTATSLLDISKRLHNDYREAQRPKPAAPVQQAPDAASDAAPAPAA